MQNIVAQGEAKSADYLGPLHDSALDADKPDVLQQRMHEDGYVYRASSNRVDSAGGRAITYGATFHRGKFTHL